MGDEPAAEPSAEELKAAELKDKANKLFSDKKFSAAVEVYTEAIDVCPSATLYSNRAMAHIKMENMGLAIGDADQCIALDRLFPKGYFRKGTALAMLGNLKQAKKQFENCLKLQPKNKDAQRKVKELDKQIKAIAFAKAIESDEKSVAAEVEGEMASMDVEASYTGPHLKEPMTRECVEGMMEAFLAQKKLHKKYMFQILIKAKEVLSQCAALVDVSVPASDKFTVCGDVHGQYYDLVNIFTLNGKPSADNPYLFNGDFCDRGSFSVECVLTLLAWKALDPCCIHLNRGNHETLNMNRMYGFQGEVMAKYNAKAFTLFTEVFHALPLCHVINEKIMVVHGGLFSKDEVKLDDLRKIDRFMEPPDEGYMCEMLWSDPQRPKGRGPSKRGVGVAFGPDVAAAFLDDNGLDLLIRSHEVKDEGYEIEPGGRVVTVFSAPNYCDQMGNKGAYAVVDQTCKPKYVSFAQVPHPHVPPMAYANPMMAM